METTGHRIHLRSEKDLLSRSPMKLIEQDFLGSDTSRHFVTGVVADPKLAWRDRSKALTALDDLEGGIFVWLARAVGALAKCTTPSQDTCRLQSIYNA